MDYIEEHKNVYDALASEYSARNPLVLEDTRQAVEFFVSYIKKNASILEVGSGSGLAAQLLSNSGHRVTAIELSPKMIEISRSVSPETIFIEGDFLKIDLKEIFDAIFTFAFIHLFTKKDAVKVLQKIHSYLKNGGIFFATTTKEEVSKEGWEEKLDYKIKQRRFRKRWTQKEFEDVLAQNGFEIINNVFIHDKFGKTWMDYVVKKMN